jgi:Arc/MetJ-type ribon-helix-helix transcriptional regulator
MHTVTARMPDEFVDELDAEYEERGFRNRTQYIRHILEHRDAIFTDQPAESDVAEQLAEHDERLADAESRLDALEASAHTHSWDDDEQGN